VSPAPWVIKRVLLGPAPVRRAAAARSEGQERWLLTQPAQVRRSYVEEVLNRGGGEDLEQAWMLLQPAAVRKSYVRDVLGVESPRK
jgi:hypothetical protein